MKTPLTWLLFVLGLFIQLDDVSSHECRDSERASLLKMQSRIYIEEGNSTSKLSIWNSSSDCCLWEGVSCDGSHVVRLELGNSYTETLAGSFDNTSSSAFPLQHLKFFLFYGHFSILNLTKFAQNFPELEELHMTFRKISSGNKKEMFRELSSSLPNLQVLALMSDLSGAELKYIANFSRLVYLELTNSSLEGTFPREVFQMQKLQAIDLSKNPFLQGTLPEFPVNSAMYYIDLSYTGFSGKLPESLGNLMNLTYLDLSNCQFDGSLPSFEFSYSSGLNILDLSHNHLVGPLPTSIFQQENLTHVDLSYNKLNGTVNLSLFQKLRALYHLDLSFNRLSVKAYDDDFFMSLPSLVHLKLASCDLEAFPRLENQSYLLTLDLSSNRISGDIPNWIWKFGDGEFSFLNLSNNNLVGLQEPYSLPISLSVIDLHSNLFHGKIPVHPNAQYLDFSNNNISSIQIPSEGLFVLGFFSFSNNSLMGTIPKSMCSFTQENLFPDLSVIDLSGNNLSGEIAPCLIEASNLFEILNLRRNNLRGPIPNAFPTGCGLKVLDLNRNLIDGEIPRSLARCTKLEILDLGHNNIVSEFPCFLKNISTLRVVILRGNKLHGGIECPDSRPGTWPALQMLDLAQNSLGGELRAKWVENSQSMTNDTNSPNPRVLGITYYFSFLLSEDPSSSSVFYQYLATVTLKGQKREMPKILTIFTLIDISCNEFRGPIPEEFGRLRGLFTLNMSNNVLSGEIPSSIGDLKKLESLDLSRNKLGGKVPSSLGQLNFLGFLNLSNNRLHGTIPKGGQIQTFSEDSFTGNEGLCGFPMRKSCSVPEHPEKEGGGKSGESETIDWDFVSVEIGLIVGFGFVVAPLVFSWKFRKWYFEHIDDFVVRIFPWSLSKKWLMWTTN